MTTLVARAPVFTASVKREPIGEAIKSQNSQNLLSTLLGGQQPNLIIIPPDFGNPVPVIQNDDLRTWIQGSSPLYAQSQVVTSTNAQPRAPVFTALWRIDNRVAVGSQTSQSVIYTKVTQVAPGQVRGPVFTRYYARDPYAAISSQPLSSPSVLLFQMVGRPTAQYDWPVPKGYAQGSVDLRWAGQATPIVLYFGQNLPIALYDWPVPKGYVPGVYLRWAGQGTPSSFIPATGTPVSKSFSYDWPNPRGPVGNVVLRTIATDGTNPNLMPPPKVIALHAPHFFSTMGMCIGAPANPPS